jgi:uncharacterized protein (TIGR03546 family)
MFLSRKIGSVLRGKATPFQVMLATLFGGLLGFVPGFFLPGDLGGGFLQAPGLILLLLCCVLVLNANLGVFGLVTLVAKLLSLVLLPVAYTIGTWLVDGPLQGMFEGLVNGKVTAWFGFEYPATVGGLVLGLVFGVGSGLVLNRSIKALRAHMAGLEAGSERYQKYSSKKSVRFLTWLFLGKGKGKLTWQELATQKKLGMPVRITGLLAAVVLVGSLWVIQTWFSTPVLTRVVQDNLQSMNGATVERHGRSQGRPHRFRRRRGEARRPRDRRQQGPRQGPVRRRPRDGADRHRRAVAQALRDQEPDLRHRPQRQCARDAGRGAAGCTEAAGATRTAGRPEDDRGLGRRVRSVEGSPAAGAGVDRRDRWR